MIKVFSIDVDCCENCPGCKYNQRSGLHDCLVGKSVIRMEYTKNWFPKHCPLEYKKEG